jgi:hypothetical protein
VVLLAKWQALMVILAIRRHEDGLSAGLSVQSLADGGRALAFVLHLFAPTGQPKAFTVSFAGDTARTAMTLATLHSCDGVSTY